MSEPISAVLSAPVALPAYAHTGGQEIPRPSLFSGAAGGALLLFGDLIVMLLAVVLPGTLSTSLIERFCLVAFVLLGFQGLRHYQIRLPLGREIRQGVLIILAAMTLQGALRGWMLAIPPDLMLFKYWLSTLVLVLVGRQMIRRLLHRRGLWRIPMVLVGNPSRTAATAAHLKNHPSLGYEVTGHIDPQELAGLAERDYRQVLYRHGGAEGAIIVLDETCGVLIEPLLRQDVLAGVVAFAAIDNPRLKSAFPLEAGIQFWVPRHRLTDPVSRGFKRLIDILGVATAILLGLTLFAPLLMGLILAIKADGGPLLFRQWRVGRHGRWFKCLKFRTMRVDAEQALHQHILGDSEKAREWHQGAKLREDPRITPIGRFLRRASLDELPQILNVLHGEMSLVGPRPVVPDEMARYGDDAAHYLRVCPGITGLWQVSGRNNLDYPTRVRLDAAYVGGWTLGQDLAILLRTLPALITGRGAC
ncbi:MAG: exopolysaccharide biosynthesis polyprenyl glycosylphosphotransferase [Pseudomonadota bacterium]